MTSQHAFIWPRPFLFGSTEYRSNALSALPVSTSLLSPIGNRTTVTVLLDLGTCSLSVGVHLSSVLLCLHDILYNISGVFVCLFP